MRASALFPVCRQAALNHLHLNQRHGASLLGDGLMCKSMLRRDAARHIGHTPGHRPPNIARPPPDGRDGRPGQTRCQRRQASLHGGRARLVESEPLLDFAYGVARKFWVREVAGPEVPLPEPTANWLTCQIRFAVAGSGVAAA